MKTRTFIAAAGVAIASAIAGSVAHAQVSQPFFEYSGGLVHAELQLGPGENFIPIGALGASSVVANGVPQPVTVTLRDPGFDGATRTVCVDYIGTDAGFQNRFYIPGTTINWCNKSTCADPTATPLGLGNKGWTAPFTASACFQMNVGQPVPFVFVADVLNQGGNGSHTVGNGQADANAHWAALPVPFVFTPPLPRTSSVLAVGLSDGAFNPLLDDDHQDFTVRFTAQGGAIPQSAIPTLGQWSLMLLVLATSLLGLRTLRRARP